MRALLRIAWRSVRKNWRHSLAALLSIASGFLALAVFEGYVVGLRELSSELLRTRFMLGDVIVERRAAESVVASEDPFAKTLTAEEQRFVDELLAGDAGVEASVRFLDVSGVLSQGATSVIFVGAGHDVPGGRAVRGASWEWDVTAGRPLHEQEGSGILLGRGLARTLDCAPEGPDRRVGPPERGFSCRGRRLLLTSSTASGQVNAVEAEVGGILDVGVVGAEVDRRYLSIPLPMAQSLADTDRVSRYAVKLKDPSRASRFALDVVAAAKGRGLELEAYPWREHRFAETYRRGIGVLAVFRNFVALVVLVVAAMSVFNTMARGVNERIRELGTLRALGFLRRQVVSLFVVEALILAGIGVLVGLLGTGVVMWAVARADVHYQAGMLSEPIRLLIAPAPAAYLVAMALLFCVSALAAWLPARRAARRKIPDALTSA